MKNGIDGQILDTLISCDLKRCLFVTRGGNINLVSKLVALYIVILLFCALYTSLDIRMRCGFNGFY
jgi:hypothetical protein